MALKEKQGTLRSSRTLFRDEIRDRIIEAILSKELMPGERIIETRLAKELGVSQSPVREAIRELEMMGLVENRPFQGSYVKEISYKDVRDSQRVRIYLDELGIVDAVEIITDEQLKELHDIMVEMENAAKNQDIKTFIVKDSLFHQKIIEISKNETLFRLWNQCNITEWTYVVTKITDRPLDFLANRHQELYEALKARDKKRAVEAIHEHFEGLIDIVKDIESKQEEKK